MKCVERKIVTPFVARQVDQQLPEPVARDRDRRPRSARRGSAPRARAAPRPPATAAGGCRAAGFGQRVGDGVEVEAVEQLVDPRVRARSRGQVEQARVQLEVLPHRQLGVEREGLRHEADALARARCRRRPPAGRTAGLAFGGGQQPGQHLHRRGLAAAVGAEEAEDLAALDAEAHVIDGGEVAEPLGQAVRLDGRRAVRGRRGAGSPARGGRARFARAAAR